MIIGRDFFKSHGVIIDHSNDSVIIDDLKINLNSIHSISNSFIEDEDYSFNSSGCSHEFSIQDKLASLSNQLQELKEQHLFVKSQTEASSLVSLPLAQLVNSQANKNYDA
jgi:hypothetical protein